MFASVLTVILAVAAALLAATLMVAAYFWWTTRRIARAAERAVPPSGRFVTVGGNRIHYVERGEGLPILMIHGLGGSLHHLRRPLMEAFGDGYRLIAIDRPGSGYSTRGAGQTGRLTEQAAQTAALIDALGLDRPLIVGHSLGGAIALATALDHPDKVSGLALLSPLTHTGEPLRPEFRGLAIPSAGLRRLMAHTLAVPMSVKNGPRTLAFVFGPQEPPPDYAVDGGAMIGLRPGHFHAASTDFMAIGRDLKHQEQRYGELAMPVGIAFGTADRVLDYQRQGTSMIGKVPHLDLEILDGVGHMPQFAETPRIVAFIRRIAERAFAERGAERQAGS